MRTGEDDVQHVLDGVRNKVSTTASKTGALEYVDNVVPKRLISIDQPYDCRRDLHHDVHARKLTPHLERSTEANAAQNTRLEQVEIRFSTLLPFKFDLVLDLRKLKLHELIVGVSTAMEIRQDRKGFVVSVVVDEPTWTLRDIYQYCNRCITVDEVPQGTISCPWTESAQGSSANPMEYGRTRCRPGRSNRIRRSTEGRYPK